jgi:hypothetical protein
LRIFPNVKVFNYLKLYNVEGSPQPPICDIRHLNIKKLDLYYNNLAETDSLVPYRLPDTIEHLRFTFLLRLDPNKFYMSPISISDLKAMKKLKSFTLHITETNYEFVPLMEFALDSGIAGIVHFEEDCAIVTDKVKKWDSELHSYIMGFNLTKVVETKSHLKLLCNPKNKHSPTMDLSHYMNFVHS